MFGVAACGRGAWRSSLGFTVRMARDRRIARREAPDDALLPLPRAPLVVLSKWPAACRPDSDCQISGTVYPAPTSLGPDDIQWWIDITEIRVNASRNLLNNSVAAVLGALVAASATAVAALTSSSPWATALAGAGSVLAVLLAGRVLLKDSDHVPLEQRLVLYRQRARELQAKAGKGSEPPGPFTQSAGPA